MSCCNRNWPSQALLSALCLHEKEKGKNPPKPEQPKSSQTPRRCYKWKLTIRGHVRWLHSVTEPDSIKQCFCLHSKRNSSFSRSWHTMYFVVPVPTTSNEVHVQYHLQGENEDKQLLFKNANAVVLPRSTTCQGYEMSQRKRRSSYRAHLCSEYKLLTEKPQPTCKHCAVPGTLT